MPGAPITGGSVVAGNMSFSSSDSSLVIDGGPALGQVDFKAGPPLDVGAVRVSRTALLDFTVPSAGAVLVPRTPGFLCLPIAATPVFTAVAATGGLTVTGTQRAGNDAGRVNVAPSQGIVSSTSLTGLLASTLNRGVRGSMAVAFVVAATGMVGALDLADPVLYDITVPVAAPGLVLQGYILLTWAKVPV